MTLAPGDEVRLDALGHHTFRVHEVRRGGMGVVAKLVGEPGMLPMALKTYQHVSDSERFEREARAWGALSGHPNIARLSWYGPWDAGWATLGLWYPLSLAEVDFRRHPDWSLALLRGIAEGMSYAVDDCGVLHRDLKPANILIDDSGRPRLADFGLASAAAASGSAPSTIEGLTSAMRSLATVGSLSGTPLYMAPELFNGVPPSASTEIYAFGVTAYEFVTGNEHPYLGADTGFRFGARFREAPLARIPSEAGFLRELLPRLVARDPRQRPASFADVLEALGHVKREWRRSSLDIMREAAVLQVQGRLEAARELVETALGERPDDPALLFARAGVLTEEGRDTEATTALESSCARVVSVRGRLEDGIYIDPLAVMARGEISRGAVARAAMRLKPAVEWTSDLDRRFFPEFGWLELCEGRPETASSVLSETVGEFTPTSLAYFAVAVAQSDRRRELAPEIARRLVGPSNGLHAAAAAVLVSTWLGDGADVRLDIPEHWSRELAALLGAPDRDLIPLDQIREDALLGSLALELVAGFDSEDEAWTNARVEQERTSTLFGLIATRFGRLFPERAELQEDMVFAVERLCRVLGYQFDGRDLRAQELVSLVSAGYVWRLAEGTRGSVAKQWMVSTVSRTFDPDESRSSSLGRAATQCLAQAVPLGLASPGGLSHGRPIFDASFGNAMRAFGNPAVVVSDEDRFYAYTFGVALCDVEPMVDSLRATDSS